MLREPYGESLRHADRYRAPPTGMRGWGDTAPNRLDPTFVSTQQQCRPDSEQQRRRHHRNAELQECDKADGVAFTTQRSQPKDRSQRTGHRKVRSKIHAYEHGSRDLIGSVRRLQRVTRDKPRRQIVDEVACQGDEDARAPCGQVDRAFYSIAEEADDRADESGCVQRLDKYEKPGDQWQYPPRDACQDTARPLPFADQDHERRECAGDRGGKSELKVERRRDKKQDGRRREPDRGDLAGSREVWQRDVLGNRLAERLSLCPPQRQVRSADRERRWQQVW